jgi:hypothetical protein
MADDVLRTRRSRGAEENLFLLPCTPAPLLPCSPAPGPRPRPLFSQFLIQPGARQIPFALHCAQRDFQHFGYRFLVESAEKL